MRDLSTSSLPDLRPAPPPRSRLRRTTLAARALGTALAILPAAVVVLHANPARAQSPTEQTARDYALAPGPLAGVLTQLASQSGILLSVDASLTAGLDSPGLRGRFTLQEALATALQGSGLRATRTGDNIYSLQRDASRPASPSAAGQPSAGSLPAIVVEPQASRETGTGPVSGFIARRSVSGTKTDTPLMETPQSVSVVTRDQMDAQGATTLVESLRYTPGIVAQYGNTDLRLDWLTLRGFTPPARYLDNLRLPFGARGYSQPRIEPWGLERVEVVKGPSSVLYGQATPGGLVNMVSKRPTLEPVREVELQFGSHNRRQAALDLGGAIDADGVWSYRLVALHREANTSYDHVSERKTYFAPSLTFRPSSATRLTVLGQWQSLDSPGGGGAPALPAAGTLDTSRYAALPTRTFVGEPGYDRFSNRQRFVGYEFEHRFNDTFTVRQNLRYGKVDAYTQRIQAVCLAACNPSSLLRYAWAFPEEASLLTADTQLQADFATGTLRHTLLAGVDFSNEKSAFDETNLRIITRPFNAYLPVFGTDSGAVPSVATHIDQKRRQTGFYLQDQIHLDRWSLVLAGRYDKADTDTRTLTTATARMARVDQHDDKFTGRAALMYNFDSGFAPYLSYSTSFQPAAGTDRQGNPFEPTTGRQIEAGLKYQPAGSKAMVTAAVYELTQRNVLTPDPLSRSFSEQTGEVRVRGLELEAKAPLARGLDVIASYAYTDSRVTRANANASGASTLGKRFPYVPEHQAALWLDYAFPMEIAPGLSLGAGVRRISTTYGDAANQFRVPGVTVMDAALRWDLGRWRPSLKGLRLALNVSNLADKTYVATCLSSTGCYYGERRSVYVTAGYSW